MRKSRFATSDVAPGDRFEAAHFAARSWAEVTEVDDPGPVHADWRMWTLDNLVVSQPVHSSLQYVRDHTRFRASDNEFLLIEAYQSGSAAGRVADEPFEFSPARIVMVDMSRDLTSVTGRIASHSLMIPHAAVGYDRSVHAATTSLAVARPGGRVLSNLMRGLPARMERLDPGDEEALARDLTDVVGALMLRRNAPQSAAVRCAQRIAMENFIEERLGDGGLGTDMLCATFGISRSSLYRRFDDRDGIAAYIRERRLLAARSAVESWHKGRGTIGEIAERVGFRDQAHFSRLFRARFGHTPRDLLGTGSANPTISVEPARLLKSWLTS